MKLLTGGLLAVVAVLRVVLPVSSTAAPHDFILAFHIPCTASDLPFLSDFLSSIHHGSNLYLLDLPPSPAFSLPPSIPPDNVHIRVEAPPTPEGISTTLLTLSAISFFLDYSDATGVHFDYFLTVSPTSQPVLTPAQTRSLLHSPRAASLPLPNFIPLTDVSALPLFAKDYDGLSYDPAIVFSQNASATSLVYSSNMHPDRHLRTRKLLPHTNSPHLLLTEAACRFLSDSLHAKRLLLLLADSMKPSSHFFPTALTDAGTSIGPLVTTTSLHCPTGSIPDQQPDRARAASSESRREPPHPSCLFFEKTASDVGDHGERREHDAFLRNVNPADEVAPAMAVESLLVEVRRAIRGSEADGGVRRRQTPLL